MPSRKAVALSYSHIFPAPVIIAQGKNELAEKLLGIAGDPVLADILSDVEIGSCIPVETYEAIASIFAFLEKGIQENWFLKS